LRSGEKRSALSGTLAGFIATVVASIVRYRLVGLGARRRVDEAKVPTVLIVSTAVASIAGSLAAHDLMGSVGADTLLGAFAGLLRTVLVALLMITYRVAEA
jgi:hypothetical protein